MAGAPTAAARALGFAGLIPFVAAAAGAWVLPSAEADAARVVLVAYGATIASFLGGIHWGFAMRRDLAPTPLLVWGVVPSLVAWGALLLPPAAGALALAAVLVACYLRDRAVFPREGAGAWLALRTPLTAVATAACVAGALAP
jgi:hypothetical protein